jgi:basic amino acid/polyamine antiporter, APA family
MIVALFAYNGWWYSTFVAGELRDPERTIPRSIFLGMGMVLDRLRARQRRLPARAAVRCAAGITAARGRHDAAAHRAGGRGADLGIAVMLSAFGTVNAQLLSVPRVYFAMARDGLFFRWVRAGASALPYAGGRDPGAGPLGVGARAVRHVPADHHVHGVPELRLPQPGRRRSDRAAVREPALPRPYRVWGYPVTPLLFLLIFAWYLVNSLRERVRRHHGRYRTHALRTALLRSTGREVAAEVRRTSPPGIAEHESRERTA